MAHLYIISIYNIGMTFQIQIAIRQKIASIIKKIAKKIAVMTVILILKVQIMIGRSVMMMKTWGLILRCSSQCMKMLQLRNVGHISP